jgi:hypothetical protein
MTDNSAAAGIEIWADDPDGTDELYVELRGVAGITMEAVPASTTLGEQGAAVDLLAVALSSGAVTALLQIIKTLVEAKGPKFVLRIRRGRNQLKITADNFDEIAPTIRRLFGES